MVEFISQNLLRPSKSKSQFELLFFFNPSNSKLPPWKINMSPNKNDHVQGNFIFQPAFFKGCFPGSKRMFLSFQKTTWTESKAVLEGGVQFGDPDKWIEDYYILIIVHDNHNDIFLLKIIFWDFQSVAGSVSHMGFGCFWWHLLIISGSDQPINRSIGGSQRGLQEQKAAKGHQTIEIEVLWEMLWSEYLAARFVEVVGGVFPRSTALETDSVKRSLMLQLAQEMRQLSSENGMTWKGTATPQTRLLSSKINIYIYIRCMKMLVDVGIVHQTFEEIVRYKISLIAASTPTQHRTSRRSSWHKVMWWSASGVPVENVFHSDVFQWNVQCPL